MGVVIALLLVLARGTGNARAKSELPVRSKNVSILGNRTISSAFLTAKAGRSRSGRWERPHGPWALSRKRKLDEVRMVVGTMTAARGGSLMKGEEALRRFCEPGDG
jgi:hypothetical protein